MALRASGWPLRIPEGSIHPLGENILTTLGGFRGYHGMVKKNNWCGMWCITIPWFTLATIQCWDVGLKQNSGDIYLALVTGDRSSSARKFF